MSSTSPYGLRPPEVGKALGSSEVARRAIYHGWLKPVIKGHRLTVFDAGDVALIWQRIRGGELPPPIPRAPRGVAALIQEAQS